MTRKEFIRRMERLKSDKRLLLHPNRPGVCDELRHYLFDPSDHVWVYRAIEEAFGYEGSNIYWMWDCFDEKNPTRQMVEDRRFTAILIFEEWVLAKKLYKEWK